MGSDKKDSKDSEKKSDKEEKERRERAEKRFGWQKGDVSVTLPPKKGGKS